MRPLRAVAELALETTLPYPRRAEDDRELRPPRDGLLQAPLEPCELSVSSDEVGTGPEATSDFCNHPCCLASFFTQRFVDLI